MPHFKCDACRIRVPCAPHQPGLPVCPDCGALMAPVLRLDEVVGYQAADALADDRWSDDGGAFAQSVALLLPQLPGRTLQ